MTSVNEVIIARIIRREAGFVDHPADKGGVTNLGVTMPILGAFLDREPTIDDMKSLNVERATRIYRRFFVIEPGFDHIEDEQLREQVIDAGVLHGTGWAVRCLQEIVGVTVDGIIGPVSLRAINFWGKTNGLGNRFMRRRLHKITRIVQRSPSQLVFLTGWVDRAASFLET